METTYKSFGSVDCDIDFNCTPCSPCPSTEFGWSYKDEILLDGDDRPLELTLNSRSALTFHVVSSGGVAGSHNDLIEQLREERFANTPEHQKHLVENFQHNIDTKTDANGKKNSLGGSSSASEPSTPRGVRTSVSSAASGETMQKFVEGRNSSVMRSLSPLHAATAVPSNTTNGYKLSIRRKHAASTSSSSAGSKNASFKSCKSAEIASEDRQQRAENEDKMPAAAATPARSGRVREVKNKQSAGKRNRSSSARRLFSSLRGKRSISRPSLKDAFNGDAADAGQLYKELSSDANLPGILKIFGDAVSPGANYKSVMATKNSNAKELCKAALERYGVPKHQYKGYVLCEVLGRVKEEDDGAAATSGADEKALQVNTEEKRRDESSPLSLFDSVKFREDHIRPMTDYEKPLVIQSFWKPLQGYCRRFEIRRRSKVITKGEKDVETRDVNQQARRLMQKSKSLHGLSSLHNPRLTQTDEDGDNDKDRKSEDSSGDDQPSSRRLSADEPTPVAPTSTGSDKHATRQQNQSPLTPPYPYLIMLQGGEAPPGGDHMEIVRHLHKQETAFGSRADCDIVLPDAAPLHCAISRRLETEFAERDNYAARKRWRATLTVDADVDVNNDALASTCERTLLSGDVVRVARKYVFMYKDPLVTSDVALAPPTVGVVDSTDAAAQLCHAGIELAAADVRRASPPRLADAIETEVWFAAGAEDEAVAAALDAYRDDGDGDGYPLAPARVLCLLALHACLNLDEKSRDATLQKITASLQSLVLDATRNVSVQELQTASNPDPDAVLSALLPVVYWMSNSLEVFEFFQHDLLLKTRERCAEERRKKRVKSSVVDRAERFAMSDEILGPLEEVVMYAFQQLVYYLTKTLYGSLPAVLDRNPFSAAGETSPPNGDGGETSQHVAQVEDIVRVLTRARDMTTRCSVNRDIDRQLFAYLFFFANVSLFNSLMEEESTRKYFRWQNGVVIQGNLEKIESWANEADYATQWSVFLNKFSTLANLLSTPKAQITKFSWSQFREHFSSLRPVQLRRVLERYQVAGGGEKPAAWSAYGEDAEAVLCKDGVMESYDEHPPLMLPVSGTSIDFARAVDDPRFVRTLARLQRKSATGSGVTGSVVGVREQPDGREKDLHAATQADVALVERELASVTLEGRAASTTSSSDSVFRRKSEVGGATITEEGCRKSESSTIAAATTTTAVVTSDAVASDGAGADNSTISPAMTSQSLGGTPGMPVEVFIVDIKRGRNGLGVGMVDGLTTVLGISGVFVRSLVPDGPNVKMNGIRRRDVIRCWLQQGRLQLGDRILAANGVSIVNMEYAEAMRTLRKSGDHARLLVGRCGADVALKVTSSTC